MTQKNATLKCIQRAKREKDEHKKAHLEQVEVVQLVAISVDSPLDL